MRKIILLLSVSLFFTISGLAQITLTGAPSANAPELSMNGTYIQESTPSYVSYVSQTPDAGTNILRKTGQLNGDYTTFTFYRVSNFWYLSVKVTISYSNGGGTSAFNLRKYETFSINNNPPCDDYWQSIEGEGGDFLQFTGFACDVTNDCQNAFAVYPDKVQIPTVSNADINAIVNPVKGMMTYDCDLHRLMLFDGFEWRTIQGSSNNLALSENSGIYFGTNANANITSSPGFLNMNTHTKVQGTITANSLILTNGDVSLANGGVQSSNSVFGNTFAGKVVTGSSVSYKTNVISGAYLTLDASHNIIFYTGNSNGYFTLPNPTTCSGRQYDLQNTISTVKLNFSGYPVYVNGNISPITSLPAGASAKIISDGTVWRKLN